ncbi:hypothetical protein TSUD_240590 [Trifolium subterraneum]|uniref:TF-B3 domain-containing protein n=1 Tax=Trifolium subterraneum TaxID=3900 RepID=A0A2Z6P1W4_TRISU|nr:hypothetical protein TSUD_240590 [Trifolium subterraneum]
MASNNIETTLALEYLRAPLNPFPTTDHEKYVNDMRVKYRTYYLEYNISDGAVMLPRMFADDFGDDICRIANLIDSNDNQFEVLVEKINENVYLTHGWASLRDFYDLRYGAWLTLMYTGYGHFGLIVQNRFHEVLTPPTHVPPMKFVINKFGIPPHFISDLPESIELLSYSHDGRFFQLAHEKTLTYYDIRTGFLMIPYDGFGEFAFDEATTSIKLVDDCGNVWNCSLIFVTFPCKYFKVGGEWGRLVTARKMSIGLNIMIGAQPNGHSETIYLIIDP